ncbi:MAG: chemotaxis protein CheX [Bdellovibrionales bacterium]|nr:chemotaxis protein CheX [Bdellovibrionales bacterium]
MDVRYVNPFIDSALNVLSTMAQTEAFSGTPKLKVDNVTWGEVTGLIGMAGDNVVGNLIISFDEPSILGIVSRMLGENFLSISDEIVDAVGEITNMISGGAKAKLATEGFQFNMATPVMVQGKHVKMSQLTTSPIISIPFETNEGKFVIEASIQRK